VAQPQFIEIEHTAAEWLSTADELSRRLVHTDARTAWAQVRAGQYEGTPFAAELSQLMFLAGQDDQLPHAAE
jgi:hypothetical protein